MRMWEGRCVNLFIHTPTHTHTPTPIIHTHAHTHTHHTHTHTHQDHVEYIPGHAKFTGPHEVTVDGVKYTGEKILIATGTKPIVPSVPGGKSVCVCVCGGEECVEWGGVCGVGMDECGMCDWELQCIFGETHTCTLHKFASMLFLCTHTSLTTHTRTHTHTHTYTHTHTTLHTHTHYTHTHNTTHHTRTHTHTMHTHTHTH